MKNPLYKVGIIGYGVVGKGIHRLLDDLVTEIYDPNMQEYNHEPYGRFNNLDMVVVCVPTPTSDDGISADTRYVQETLEWLEEIKYGGVVLLKSTTPPSDVLHFAEYYSLRLVFSPEFMGESKYYTPFWKYPDPSDMRTHMWQTFGGARKNTQLCVEIFKRKMSVDTQFFQTDIATAALAKYIENSFFALKVTFVNEWYDIAKQFGVDWNELRELWLADPRINRNHTLVFDKDRGYGGKCFPKDVKAIIADARNMGYEPSLMVAVDATNEKFRKLNE